jgi:hypothetical protein
MSFSRLAIQLHDHARTQRTLSATASTLQPRHAHLCERCVCLAAVSSQFPRKVTLKKCATMWKARWIGPCRQFAYQLSWTAQSRNHRIEQNLYQRRRLGAIAFGSAAAGFVRVATRLEFVGVSVARREQVFDQLMHAFPRRVVISRVS